MNYVFLLVKFGFFERKKYKRIYYYVSFDQDARLSFQFKKGVRSTDIPRWKSDFRDYYLEKEPSKAKALASFIKDKIKSEEEHVV